ncbi:MAG: SRPBCC family protein [Gammaproteobacteria bacterium]
MRFLKLFAISIAVIILITGLIGIFLPKDFSVRRSISINASNELIHNFVGNLDNWEQWTTWKLDDPSMLIFKGSKSQGVGASQSWKGDSGEGKLEITESSAEKGIVYDLYFDGGDQKSVSSMLYSKDGDNTLVTWSMSGSMEIPVLGGYFVMMIDSMIGQMFDRGLKRLKTVSEKKANKLL